MNDVKGKMLVSLNIAGSKGASKKDFDQIRKIVLDAIERLEKGENSVIPGGGTNGVISPVDIHGGGE